MNMDVLAPAIRRIAGKHTPPHPYDRDDLVQEGLLAVVKLAAKRRPELGERAWTAYALMRAEGAMLDLMRQARWGKRWHHDPAMQPVSLDAHVQGMDEPITVVDTLPDVEDDSELHVAEHVARLPERERVIVEMAMDGFSRREIGDALGVTESRVSQIIRDQVRERFGSLVEAA